jgi:KDO2-lipid IV(A) lauroyltransferase
VARKRKPIADFLVYGGVRALLVALAWLPEWIVYPPLDSLGRLFFLLGRRRRRIALESLRLALGPEPSERELARIGSEACGNAFMVAADVARAGRIVAAGKLHERVDSSAWRTWLPDMDRIGAGKPPILCTPHLGSWEICGLAAGAEFHGLHIIARPLGNPRLQAFVKRTRSLTGIHVHPRRGGVRHLIAALRAGQAVGTLPDQNQRLRAIFVPVFGKLAACDRSQARLAQITGAPIVVGSAIRVGRRFRFRIELVDMFTVAPEGGDGDPVYEATLRLHKAVEKLILMAPDQYFWVHNRYRTRPPEEIEGSPKKKTA